MNLLLVLQQLDVAERERIVGQSEIGTDWCRRWIRPRFQRFERPGYFRLLGVYFRLGGVSAGGEGRPIAPWWDDRCGAWSNAREKPHARLKSR